MPVALLAEGVDRNVVSWTAWILMTVALLAEGVDRNKKFEGVTGDAQKSPSSRRAWIEMAVPVQGIPRQAEVALLAEGVDRNCPLPFTAVCLPRRPPRGGHG